MRFAAWLVACLAAGPVAGQEVQQVTGVAASDVLQVRRAPSANAPVIGALSPLADFVILRERRGAWARIEYERGASVPVRGWVAARHLERAYGGAGPADGPWACYGTEPFWSVWLEGNEVRYRTDDGTTVTPLTDLRSGRNEPGASWTFTFGGADPTRATMLAGTVCSDGMSEVTTRRALLLISSGGALFTGCCRRPVADERPPEPE